MRRTTDYIDVMNYYGKKKTPFLFIIDFEMNQPLVFKLDEIDSNKILFKTTDLNNYQNMESQSKELIFIKHPVSFDNYEKGFKKVIENLNAGNTYLCNLTFPTRIEVNYSLREIFYASNANYKLFYDDMFTVFSPEGFVKIINGQIYSFPMKGTIDASIPNAENILLNNAKELAEHTTIVDLIRNDLSIVAREVTVEKFRYIERINTNQKNLLQVSSKISGRLPEDYNSKIGDIIFKLLPAGSICGAPKMKTLEIIKDAENYNRGFYTGIFGVFDGKNLDSAVMIRFIEKQYDEFYFKSGGGITALSNPYSEYQELIDKVYVPII